MPKPPHSNNLKFLENVPTLLKTNDIIKLKTMISLVQTQLPLEYINSALSHSFSSPLMKLCHWYNPITLNFFD
jgi:hypothetical protein